MKRYVHLHGKVYGRIPKLLTPGGWLMFLENDAYSLKRYFSHTGVYTSLDLVLCILFLGIQFCWKNVGEQNQADQNSEQYGRDEHVRFGIQPASFSGEKLDPSTQKNTPLLFYNVHPL